MQKKDVSPISSMKTSLMKMSFGCSKNGKVWTLLRFLKINYQSELFLLNKEIFFVLIILFKSHMQAAHTQKLLGGALEPFLSEELLLTITK